MLSWSSRRKLVYLGTVIVLGLAALTFVWRTYFTIPATCSDSVRNGNEQGVDCGGSCALLCRETTRDPVVLWARSFPNGEHTYTAAAYIQNNNLSAGVHGLGYAFQLFDADNKLIIEQDGVIDLPPVVIIPLIEPTVEVGNRVVARTLLTFSHSPQWSRFSTEAEKHLSVSGQEFSPDGTRLSATIRNGSIFEVREIVVAGVLFDAEGVARAASKSYIHALPSQRSQEVVFTWPSGVELPQGGIVRAEVTILPSF